MAMQMYAMTDVGRKRKHNEDHVGVAPSLGFAVLADGMGGYNAGEVASAMAVDIVSHHLKEQLTKLSQGEIDENTGLTGESMLIRDAIKAANDAIVQMSRQKPECKGMGTTVLAAVFYADRISAAHVGDSRMYRLRDGRLEHVTEDHSLVRENVRRGLLSEHEARNSRIKNIVTRALGLEAGVEADVVEAAVCAGDIYLMCSDGLTDVVPDEVIQQTLTASSRNLKKAGKQLIELANDAGGPDNISIILIRADASFTINRGLFSRLFGKK